MLPMPQRITEVLFAHKGVTLAKTLADFYVVGLDYSVGNLMLTWDPTTDYFGSKDLDEARSKFLEYSGQTPPVNNIFKRKEDV